MVNLMGAFIKTLACFRLKPTDNLPPLACANVTGPSWNELIRSQCSPNPGPNRFHRVEASSIHIGDNPDVDGQGNY